MTDDTEVTVKAAWAKEALASLGVESVHDASPEVGHYRYRAHKTARWEPCAIWNHEGQIVCRISDRMVNPSEIWTWVAGNKMPKADVLYAFKNGRWPSDAPAPIGDNLPPSDDPFEQLTRELEAEAERVRAWVEEPHEGKTAADMAANGLDNLRKLEKKTVAAFDAEKAPALAESNRIDVKWRGLKGLADQTKRLMSDRYDVIARKEKKRLQDIADAKAREDAEKKRKEWEAEQAKKEALAKEHHIHLAPEEPPLFPEVLQAPPVKVAFGGAQGSKIAPKKQSATALVEDWAKVAAHYSGSPKVREMLQKLANADAKNGIVAAGCKIIPGE